MPGQSWKGNGGKGYGKPVASGGRGGRVWECNWCGHMVNGWLHEECGVCGTTWQYKPRHQLGGEERWIVKGGVKAGTRRSTRMSRAREDGKCRAKEVRPHKRKGPSKGQIGQEVRLTCSSGTCEAQKMHKPWQRDHKPRERVQKAAAKGKVMAASIFPCQLWTPKAIRCGGRGAKGR